MSVSVKEEAKLSARSWVPAGLAGATAIGALGLGWNVSSKLADVHRAITAEANARAIELVKIQNEITMLRIEFERQRDAAHDCITLPQFENWALRLSLANEEGLEVPQIVK